MSKTEQIQHVGLMLGPPVQRLIENIYILFFLSQSSLCQLFPTMIMFYALLSIKQGNYLRICSNKMPPTNPVGFSRQLTTAADNKNLSWLMQCLLHHTNSLSLLRTGLIFPVAQHRVCDCVFAFICRAFINLGESVSSASIIHDDFNKGCHSSIHLHLMTQWLYTHSATSDKSTQ